MGYSNMITRSNADVLIPDETSAEILKSVAEVCPLLRLSKKLPNLSRSTRSMPVLSSMATAYFVSGDTGLKQTSSAAWENKYITAEELAVIIPIPEAVLADSAYDIWAEIKPQIVDAMSAAIIGAILYGTNIPSSWTTDMGCAGLVAGANTASQVISLAAYSDLYEAILGETAAGADGLFMLVEADGFMNTGTLAHLSMRGSLRNCRDTNGQPIFKPSMQDATRYELDGTPIFFPTDGSINPSSSLLISGQWDRLVYAMRQDLTYKVLTEAVIQDAGGNIVYNLAQQDMVALRAVMRLGFALPNPINRVNPTAATRFPFAVLTA